MELIVDTEESLVSSISEGYILFTKYHKENEVTPRKFKVTLQKGTTEKSVSTSLFHRLCEFGQLKKTAKCLLGITYYALYEQNSQK